MKLITEITNEPRQKHLLPIDGYDRATFYLEYKPNQNGWFFGVEFSTFAVYNVRLTTIDNILGQWKKILPFGLACVTANGLDPMTDNEFDGSTGNTQIYLMTADEAATVEANVYGQ